MREIRPVGWAWSDHQLVLLLLLFLFIKLPIILDSCILVLLVLGHQISHVGLSLCMGQLLTQINSRVTIALYVYQIDRVESTGI